MELDERRIANYLPSEHARQLLTETNVALMVGVSGAGRDTIIRALVEQGGYHPLVTATTRLPRVNDDVMEQDGVDYHFLTEDQARGHMGAGDYLEVSLVHDHINGLLVHELQRAHDSHKIAITDIDPQGAFKYRQLDERVIAIFVLPPSYDEWMTRLHQRYENDDEFNAAWPRRKQSAVMELKEALKMPFYHFVVNDNIHNAVELCDDIAHGIEPPATSQQHGIEQARSLLAQLETKE